MYIPITLSTYMYMIDHVHRTTQCTKERKRKEEERKAMATCMYMYVRMYTHTIFNNTYTAAVLA